jgi:hypothetical protein
MKQHSKQQSITAPVTELLMQLNESQPFSWSACG